jgi:hypothetical protein
MAIPGVEALFQRCFRVSSELFAKMWPIGSTVTADRKNDGKSILYCRDASVLSSNCEWFLVV